MTQKDKRWEYLKETIKKYVSSEPKLTESDLAYLLFELHDFSFLDAKKLVKLLNKELK